LIPSSIVVTVAAQSPTIIKVDYTRIESAETLQMPFSVSDKYEEK
jgi:hypothetical protein